MKIYAVVEPKAENGVRIFSLCASQDRAEEIAQQKHLLGYKVRIDTYEDRRAEKERFTFNVNAELSCHPSSGRVGIINPFGCLIGATVEAYTIAEAEEKARAMLTAYRAEMAGTEAFPLSGLQ